ncbi:MAG TPA: bifunctional helix-turn-helix domain-containing protein/methylated-DNA--[protein]-cysteine S-methyltransferase [Paracoccaceae bacterium]|nr:bifunctional helix-turn-helix domain-containing protein/methylated-DNA--[protein]-cysteine S-methyltransferase [Paracoccaceae bacterium]
MNVETHPDRFNYDLMAAALRYIEERAGEQPSLEEVAAAIGLSPAHFQRVFSRWVGVSPKRYLQYLTLDHARHLLRERFTVLDATYEAGLSSPGRLHDLFVRWEAMTPGEYARDGAGLVIRHGWFDTPFGEALAMGTERGLCGLAFSAECGREAAMADMRARWPAAELADDAQPLRPWIEAAFGSGAAVPLAPIGAPFQIKVWEALLAVPSGHVTTYSEIAKRIGNPRAVRAVGTAVGRNPVSWLIPCHRALRRDGQLGGYHWGLPVKRAMLAWEAARLEA